jgi:hypothetical protein
MQAASNRRKGWITAKFLELPQYIPMFQIYDGLGEITLQIIGGKARRKETTRKTKM